MNLLIYHYITEYNHLEFINIKVGVTKAERLCSSTQIRWSIVVSPDTNSSYLHNFLKIFSKFDKLYHRLDWWLFLIIRHCMCPKTMEKSTLYHNHLGVRTVRTSTNILDNFLSTLRRNKEICTTFYFFTLFMNILLCCWKLLVIKIRIRFKFFNLNISNS